MAFEQSPEVKVRIMKLSGTAWSTHAKVLGTEYFQEASVGEKERLRRSGSRQDHVGLLGHKMTDFYLEWNGKPCMSELVSNVTFHMNSGCWVDSGLAVGAAG